MFNNTMKEPGFIHPKWLEKSCIRHQIKSLSFHQKIVILNKNYKFIFFLLL